MSRATSSGPKRRDDDCEMVTSLQTPALSKLEMYLHEAARRNDIDILKKVLSKKTVNLDCRNQLDRTPLHMAVSHGNLEAVEILLKAKASVDLPDKYGMTPLLWAAYFGHINIVEILFDAKASIIRKNKQGMNVIHIAAETNNMALFEYVFSKKKSFKIDEPEANGLTPVMIAAGHGSMLIVDKLMERDCRIDLEDNTKMNCLHHAVKGGHVEVMRRLVTNEALMKKKDTKDDTGRAPLHYACELGHVGAVKCLLAAQVDIDLESNYKRRENHPIHLAAQNTHCEILRLLIKANCQINAQNSHGNTALHEAALAESVDACRTLIECGIEIDMPNSRLQTALHAAVEQNKPDTVEILLLAGSNTQLLDKTGKTPLLLATRGSYISLVDMIIKAERYHERRRMMRAFQARQAPASLSRFTHQLDSASIMGGSYVSEAREDMRLAMDGMDVVDGASAASVRLNGSVTGGTQVSTAINGASGGSVIPSDSRSNTIGPMSLHSRITGSGRTASLDRRPSKSGSVAPSYVGSMAGSISPSHRSVTSSARRRAEAEERMSVREAADSVVGIPLDQSITALAAAPHLPLPDVDDVSSGTFRPVDFRNTYNIHTEESRSQLEDGNYRLKEFNQVYAEEFKLFLWRIASKHLRQGEWKKLAYYWSFRNEHISAIEHQFTGALSYKQHGYRLLCIWFHGVDRNETPVRQLYEALVAIGRKELADRVRISLDAGLSKSNNGKCAVS